MKKIRLYSSIATRDTYCDVGNETLYLLQDFITYNGFQSKPENVQYFQWLLHIASRQKGIYTPYYIMIMAKRIFEYDLQGAYNP